MASERFSFSHTLLVLAFLGSFVACEKAALDDLPSLGSKADKEPKIEITDYPLARQLTDSQGRPLDGHIIAKAEGSLYVLRSSDAMNFQIPVESLSKADQEFAERLPDLMPPPAFQHGEVGVTLERGKKVGTKKAVPAYIASRQKEIDRLEEKIDRLDTEIRGTSNQMLIRSRETQIRSILNEITELKAAIERYELEQNS